MLNYSKIHSIINYQRTPKETLAKHMGIAGSTLRSRLERENLTPNDIEKLADFFGTTIAYFFDREEKEHVVVNDTATDNSEVEKLKMRLEFIEEQMEKKEKLIAQLHRENGALEEKLSNMGGSISQQSVG